MVHTLPSLIVGSLVGGLITWGVAHFYYRRGERTLSALPDRVVDVLVRRGVIGAEREAEARTAARQLTWADWEYAPSLREQVRRRGFRIPDASAQSSESEQRKPKSPNSR